MPPILALTLSLAMMLALLWRESRVRPGVSIATWIPTLWIMILSSRSVGQWLNLGSPTSADAYLDGSPIDRTVYLILMAAAFVVLLRRRFAWGDLVSQNTVWVVFFLYCGLSVVWSDFPAVAFRRWFKSIGDPLIVLVLLTEARPARAVEVVLRRVAYVLLPLSVVFIKYYPHLGRVFSPWGAMYHTGVTTNKNLLGFLLMVFGLFFVCSMMSKHNATTAAEKRIRRGDAVIGVVFLLMIQFLFQMANSATAFAAFLGAVIIAISVRVPLVRAHFGKFAIVGVIVLALCQVLFDIQKVAIEGLGRDTTFTGRTDIWDLVLSLQPNPLLGAGFETFWLGERLLKMWAAFPVFLPNQAHNGYLEMYLNLGIVGLLLFAAALSVSYVTISSKLSTVSATSADFVHEYTLATMGLGFFVAYMLYNVTEATFKPLTLLFIVFLIATIKCPRQPEAVEARTPSRWGTWRGPGARPSFGNVDWRPAPETFRTGHGNKPATGHQPREASGRVSQWRPRGGPRQSRQPFESRRGASGSPNRESSLQWRASKIREKPD